jgi:hypothetical protein
MVCPALQRGEKGKAIICQPHRGGVNRFGIAPGPLWKTPTAVLRRQSLPFRLN